MPQKEYITFPPGGLGPEPTRIPILGADEEWIAFSKPAGVAATPHYLNGDHANLLEAIREGIRQGKRQFSDLGLADISKVHLLEPEVTGVAVFGRSDKAGAALREALGSQQIEFVYDLLSDGAVSMEPRECNLPVAYSRTQMQVSVSHLHGKKSLTTFTPIARYGRYGLWEARTRESRPLQVRLHACEVGLFIPGERRFGHVPPVLLSAIKKKYRRGSRPERPLHGPLCLHLRQVILQAKQGQPTVIECPQPRSLRVALAMLEEHLGCERIAD